MFDFLIQNAQVIDGTGRLAFPADIAIHNNRIAAIGQFDAKTKQTINARGLTLIPGIIDPHSHADLIPALSPSKQTELMRCKLAQGITTQIIGTNRRITWHRSSHGRSNKRKSLIGFCRKKGESP